MDQLLLECTTLGLSAGDGEQQVASIVAPVFDARGQVALIVGVHPLCALSAREIDGIGERLKSRDGRGSATRHHPLQH